MSSKKSKFFTVLVFVILLTGFSAPVLLSQRFKVEAVNQPLNHLLVGLRQQYPLQFSFDDLALSRFKVTVNGHFNSEAELMDALLKNVSLKWERMGTVIVISPVEVLLEPKQYLLTAQVIDRFSGEPLPFTHVLINSYNTVTDLNGVFSYKSASDSLFHVRASHLGCFVADTVLPPAKGHKIPLTPVSQDLPEIIIKDNIVQRSVQVGEEPGQIVLNTYIANYLPGNGDNSVFNLLRLQPGILAAGEQPNDIIIWGSNEGTSRVQFDGFTIWGLKNFNDQISAVNPFLAKNIHVLKGGYDATNPDVVGGLVNITGKLGNPAGTGISLFVNNQTLNGMVEVPVGKKSTLLFAYRQNYYNLFDEEDLLKKNPDDYTYKITVTPEYAFRDFNFKYSLQGSHGDLFYLSFLAAKDQFSYLASQERERNLVNQESQEHNRQYGGAMFYGKNWNDGFKSQFKMAWSTLRSEYGLTRTIENIRFNRVFNTVDELAANDIGEFTVELKNTLYLSNRHTMDFGLECVRNEVLIREDTFNVVRTNQTATELRTSLFFQDAISLGTGVSIVPGFRMNYLLNLQRAFFTPRLALKMGWNNPLKGHIAWGMYHQFLVKTSVMDEDGNYRHSWAVADAQNIPILEANHLAAGLSYHLNNLTVSMEGYYKTTRGITHYIRLPLKKESVFEGKGRSYGLDFYLKQDFGRHTIWTSYTLGYAEELFPYFLDQEYRRAPQDQRHEVKVTGLFNLHPFHLSAAYVYGSGFPLYDNYISKKYTQTDYSRLDLSVVYKWKTQKVDGEVGCSVLNALNTDNVKYSSFERIPLDQLNTVYIDAEAVDFTPLLFFKIYF